MIVLDVNDVNDVDISVYIEYITDQMIIWIGNNIDKWANINYELTTAQIKQSGN